MTANWRGCEGNKLAILKAAGKSIKTSRRRVSPLGSEPVNVRLLGGIDHVSRFRQLWAAKLGDRSTGSLGCPCTVTLDRGHRTMVCYRRPLETT